MAGSFEAQAASHVESLVQWKRREGAATNRADESGTPGSVGIIGAGMMGTAIAAALLQKKIHVVIADTDAAALTKAPQRIAAETGRTDDLSGMETTADVGLVARCDLVLESILENPAAKQQVYSQVEPRLGPAAVLASNTSTIPICRLAEGLADPGRFCGLHFFHPVRRRMLVEVVRGPRTSEATIHAASALARAIGRLPLVVADGPGFLVNRLLLPYLTEGLELLLDGASMEQVESAALDFGMAMGPLRLLDEIGHDTALLAGRVLWHAFPERIVASPLLVTMYKAGRMGRKTGAGFFRYPPDLGQDQAGLPAPAVGEMIAKWARPPRSFRPEAIVDRLLLPMVLEAARVLEEGVVRDPRDVDLGVLFGLGFPAARGGLLYWADGLGPQQVLDRLRPLEPLGLRMQPGPLLLTMASEGRRFYGKEA